MREYHYRVDGEGRIFHDGTEIVDAPTLRLFVMAMQPTPDGRHLVMCQGERNWFAAEDTPLVVQRLGLRVDGGRLLAVELGLAGGHREALDPATLETGRGHLYCRVRRGQIVARFGRVPMQQLAPFLTGDGNAGGAALMLDGARHPIADRASVTT